MLRPLGRERPERASPGNPGRFILLLGTGATQKDLLQSALGCNPGDTGAPDAAGQRAYEWPEEQHASLVADLLDNAPDSGDPDSDTGEDLLLHRIGLLGPVLSHPTSETR